MSGRVSIHSSKAVFSLPFQVLDDKTQINCVPVLPVQPYVCSCLRGLEGINDLTQHTYHFITIIPKYPHTTGTTYIRLLNQLLPNWQTHWLRLSLLSGAEKKLHILGLHSRREGARGREREWSHSSALLQRETSKQWRSTWETKNLPPGSPSPRLYKLSLLHIFNSEVLS